MQTGITKGAATKGAANAGQTMSVSQGVTAPEPPSVQKTTKLRLSFGGSSRAKLALGALACCSLNTVYGRTFACR